MLNAMGMAMGTWELSVQCVGDNREEFEILRSEAVYSFNLRLE